MVGAFIALLWVVLALGTAAAGMRYIMRFFNSDYGGNRRKRLLDNFLGTALFSLAISCFMMATAESKQGSSSLAMFPFALCLGAVMFPIGMVGMYWRSFQSDMLFGKHNDLIGVRKPDVSLSEAEPKTVNAVPRPAVRIAMALAGWTVGAIAMFGLLYWRPESTLVCGVLVLFGLGGFFGPVLWLWWARKRSNTL